MIETFCQELIRELGATGILVMIMLLVLIYSAGEISRPLKVINGELGEIRDLLKEALATIKR